MGPTSIATRSLYAESVNPQWVRLLELLGMNVRYDRCQGVELFAEDGTAIRISCRATAYTTRVTITHTS